MRALLNSAMRPLRDDDGATAIEYAILAAMIAIFLATGLTGLGGSVADVYETVRVALVPAPEPPSGP